MKLNEEPIGIGELGEYIADDTEAAGDEPDS